MRGFLTLALLSAAAWPAAAEENEAERLYRSMEKKVGAAKTLRVRFDITIVDTDAKTWSQKGTLTLGEGDRFRAEAKGKLFGAAFDYTEVSDGKTSKSVGYERPRKEKAEASPRGAGAYYRRSLPREGFFSSHLDMDERVARSQTTLSDFKLAGKEKIGKRDARAIQFTVKHKGKVPMAVKLWLDAKTNLPVKLAITGGEGDVADVTETYSEFAIDPELDKKLWQLPK